MQADLAALTQSLGNYERQLKTDDHMLLPIVWVGAHTTISIIVGIDRFTSSSQSTAGTHTICTHHERSFPNALLIYDFLVNLPFAT